MADFVTGVGSVGTNGITPNSKTNSKKDTKSIGGVFTEEQLEFLEKIKEDSKNDKLTKNQNLGKDQFMLILLKQLSNQNPLEPVQDKEFIAQMAQFSSLENMQEMNSNFSNLTKDVGSIKEVINKLGTKDGELSGLLNKMSTELSQINESIKKLESKKTYSE